MEQCLLQTDYKIIKGITYSIIFIIILLSDIVKEGVIVVDEGPWIAII
jgi:hypothetical protein